MFQDLRYAKRVLLKNKGWTAMVVLLLALGIGANTTLFSAMNGILLRPLPVANPGGLVRFRYVGQNDMATNRSEYGFHDREGGLEVRTTFSYALYQQFVKSNQTLSDVIAFAPATSVNVVADGQAEIASAFVSSGNYYSALGVKTVQGRTITAEDDRPGASPVAVISSRFWNRRFANNPEIVGKTVNVNNTPVTIVGVTAPEFTGVQRPVSALPDISFPLALLATEPQLSIEQRPDRPTYWWLQVGGRLKPGVTPNQVEGNLGGVFQQTAREGLDAYLAALSAEERETSGNRNRTHMPALRVSSGAFGFLDEDPGNLRAVTMLTIVVALILIMVCANTANLLLSRAAFRSREISIRLSLGATRGRIVRQLLVENALLAFIGGGCGLIVAFWAKELLPDQNSAAPIDLNVLLFTLVLTLATALVFGIGPAFHAARNDVNVGLKEGSRTVAGSRSLLGRSLVVVQVSVSLVLLIGSGLFLRTVRNLRSVDVGFNSRDVLVFRVNPRLNRYEPPRIASLFERMKEGLKAVPGVQSVSFSNAPLLSGYAADTNLLVEGREDSISDDNVIYQLTVDRDFFETMQIPIVQGRNFDATDTRDSGRVAVINESAARRFFPNQNPLGLRGGTSPETRREIEIIGVVRDAKYDSIRAAAPPTMYFSYTQRPVTASVAFEVRLEIDAADAMPVIRQAIRGVDPNLPVFAMSTQTQQIDNRLAQERIFAQAYSLFGGLALLLASIGLFALVSYNVARRTNEIGIRFALGAQRFDVLAMVLRESATLVAIGLVIGLVSALAAGRFVASLLFGLAPTDVFTMSAAMLVMVAVCMFAALLPARRAARVDPMVALRHE